MKKSTYINGLAQLCMWCLQQLGTARLIGQDDVKYTAAGLRPHITGLMRPHITGLMRTLMVRNTSS